MLKALALAGYLEIWARLGGSLAHGQVGMLPLCIVPSVQLDMAEVRWPCRSWSLTLWCMVHLAIACISHLGMLGWGLT
jgi:hypothetical protein